MIELKNVTKIIGKKNILNNIDFKFEKGKVYLLKGHNGSGKTMLLRMVCGFISPTKGEVISNQDYSYGVIIENPEFFLQETAFYNLKYLANINKKINTTDIENWLKKFNLFKEKDKKVKSFSLGMRQRLALCQAFMENPDVLLLDEPFNALDDVNLEITYKVLEEAKKNNKIIIIASHGVNDNFKYDQIIRLSDGTISS